MIVVQFILVLLGIVSIIYGLLVVSIIGASAFFNFVFVLIGAAFVLLAAFLKKILLWPKWILIAAAVVIILVLINFTVTQARLLSFDTNPRDDAQYVIILGCKVNQSGPSLEFERRISAAAEFAKTHPECKIITTGGKGSDEPEAEGTAAKKRLIALGINEDRILVEDKSTSTRENFQFAEDVVLKEDGKSLKDASVVIVSSKFHLYRANKYANAQGINDTSFIGVVGKKILLPQYYLREYGGVVFESLKAIF